MKKLNASEVSSVVGGTISLSSCSITYAKDTMSVGLDKPVEICNAINTCTSKNGETVTKTIVDLSKCN